MVTSRPSTRTGLRFALCLVLAGGIAGGISGATANAQEEFISGRNVQPSFEGWERNADGSFTMVFGYLNRNYVEAPDVPIGPNNQFEPGPVDRGQPTHFYPRRQMYVFKVRVPADWGKKELVWSVAHNGRTDRAVGWLAPFYEIDVPVYRAQRSAQSARASTDDERRDQPPSIALAGPETITTTVGSPVTLAVTVRDDGLPGPLKGPGFLEKGDTGTEINDEKHDPTHQDMVNIYSAQRTGLAVTWLKYRSPVSGTVTFDSMVVPLDAKGGRASTTVRFGAPGTYVIRAVADDQILTAPMNVTVTVQPRATR